MLPRSCRDLMMQNIRKVGRSILTNERGHQSDLGMYRALVRVGLRVPRYGFIRRHGSMPVYDTKLLFSKSFSMRSSSITSTRSVVTYQALIAWKRLLKIASFSDYVFPSISRIARAFSLALTHSPILVPGVLALTSGQLAWAQRVSAETGYFPSRNAFNMSAQYRDFCLTSVRYLLVECVFLLLRTLYLGFLFSPSIMMAPFADCCGSRFRELWLYVVLQTLENAGPTFIKWGQWAASRPDLFPRDLCKKLSKLHSKAPEHSYAYTRKTIERAFGRKLSDIFDDFEEAPVASGSIAQVHRASLKLPNPGKNVKPRVVAVKVRHPNVGESLRRDFMIINLVAKMSNVIPALKWLRLDESLEQFSVLMMSQVDLTREAAHLSRFIYNFRRWKDVSFPEPVYPLVHPTVLVETYEQGESVSCYVDGLKGHKELKSAISRRGTDAIFQMLLVDNFIHADLHSGNILVREPEEKSSRKWFRSKPHVIFLDVGMTIELSGSDQVNLLDFFKAVARRDGRTAAECTLRLSKQQNCPNPKAFIEELDEAFTFWGSPEGDVVPPAECMHQLLEKVQCHRVNVDGKVCTLMVSLLVLEDWQRKLDPNYNVLDTIQAFLLPSLKDTCETILPLPW